jgi:hypothetical protein
VRRARVQWLQATTTGPPRPQPVAMMAVVRSWTRRGYPYPAAATQRCSTLGAAATQGEAWPAATPHHDGRPWDLPAWQASKGRLWSLAIVMLGFRRPLLPAWRLLLARWAVAESAAVRGGRRSVQRKTGASTQPRPVASHPSKRPTEWRCAPAQKQTSTGGPLRPGAASIYRPPAAVIPLGVLEPHGKKRRRILSLWRSC